jgi:signal transduction histidine kinase/ActR/RegA family two-component response regulator
VSAFLRPSRAAVPYTVFAVAVVLTLLGTYYVVRTSRARDELRFVTASQEARHLIDIRLHNYVELLRSAVALFGASEHVSRDEFRAFVARLRLRERYPGVRGIGYAIRVAKEEVNDPGRHLDRLSIEDIRVWPPGVRDEYTAILYLEPLDEGNRLAIGYDMFTHPVRRAAMERARDTGEPAASGKLTLIQELGGQTGQPGGEGNVQAGFLVYLPVYRNGARTDTVEERREAVTGYVYGPFRTGDLLADIFGERMNAALDFRIYDGLTTSPTALMHETVTDRAPTPPELLRATYTIEVEGRPWTVEFVGQRHFDSASPMWLAPLTFSGGMLISLALLAIMLGQSHAREGAEHHAAQLRASEEALRESEARLRRLVVLEREARAEAQAADRAKDEFLATLSHELRTPLNAMLGWVTMLRSGKVREERQANALEVIERNARTQARLIEDLLDVSRIITGKVRLELHPLQIGPIAQTVVDGLRPGADAKGIQLQTSIDRSVGPVMGDAARLQQIVWNLVSNAIKFTPPGGRISLALRSQDDAVELTVGDSGIGIAPDFLPHVFERFRQADSSTTRTHSGVGLGLAIVRHLVELHGGRISAHSDGENQGATFVVRLPLATRAAAAGVGADRPGRVALEGMRVLVVDDDVDTREMMTEALAAAGAAVAGASCADEALAHLQNGGADILVSDIGMPDVDGYMLIRRIRQLQGEAGRIPAIALTAYARPEDREHAIDAGFQLHLAKPIEIDALLSSLASLTQRSMPNAT